MRFSPHTPADRAAMLAEIGVSEVADLFQDIPAPLRLPRPLDLPQGLPESELGRLVEGLAARNGAQRASFLGGGAYDHYIPAAVGELLRRSEFYTSYTPYQAEVSQGTLQAIFEFQSLIAALTGLDVAQASLYDGATALAEAAMLACGHTGRRRILVARSVDPQYRAVLRTYAEGRDLEVVELPLRAGRADLEDARGLLPDAACLIVQQPNFFGLLEPTALLAAAAQAAGALYVAATSDPLSLAVLRPPGDYGADIAVGEAQSLGSAPSFGGPYLGYMAAKQRYLRRLPGRIVGEATDAEGRRGFVLTLQTREQHIRRERATSNICTNQGLMALAATIYVALLGPGGLRQAAALSIAGAHRLRADLEGLPGLAPAFPGAFAAEFAMRSALPCAELQARLLAEGLLGPLDLGRFYPELEGHVLFSVTEQRTPQEIGRLVSLLREVFQ